MQAFHFDTVDSTNETAKRLWGAGRITQRAYVLAREQTAGKGNHGRVWLSPKDAGIYVTIVDFPPEAAAPSSTLFTLAAGVACGEVLRERTGLDVRLKPINDLYVGGRKLGGILTEAMIEQGHIRALLTGIGINTHRADRPVSEGSVSPVSLEELLDADHLDAIGRDDVVQTIVRSVQSWNTNCWKDDRERVRVAWSRLSLTGSRCPL